VGEPSGDQHAAELIGELRRLSGERIEFCGFGGPLMAEAGCEQMLYPLARYALVGFAPVLAHAGRFLSLLSEADRYLHHYRPDAVVLVDFPGFNWWIARRAKARGIPVFYYLPPQIWAWATWRVAKMRKLVDLVLCCLPFEAQWYRDCGVNAVYVGHPSFDRLERYKPDQQFLARHRATPSSPVVTILPGSRDHELARVLPVYLRTSERIAARVENARFLVACLSQHHAERVRSMLAGTQLDVQVCVGRTPEAIQCSTICLSKSGSISLELLYYAKPSTILYVVNQLDYLLYRFALWSSLVRAPYITLVNLLAGRELFPEYVSTGDVSAELSGHALRWLEQPAARAELAGELERLRERVIQTGATTRAAERLLQALDVGIHRGGLLKLRAA
jgi:lipid-A-disaccharide synthase